MEYNKTTIFCLLSDTLFLSKAGPAIRFIVTKSLGLCQADMYSFDHLTFRFLRFDRSPGLASFDSFEHFGLRRAGRPPAVHIDRHIFASSNFWNAHLAPGRGVHDSFFDVKNYPLYDRPTDQIMYSFKLAPLTSIVAMINYPRQHTPDR